jgi:hypothetical protein
MAEVPPTPTSSKKHGTWRNLSKGLIYAATNGLIMSLVLVFALREFQHEMSSVFLPFFAADILDSGATGFGFLNMAQGMGGLVGLFGIATLGNFRYKGRLIIGSGLLLGVFLGVNAFGTVFENVSRTVLQTIVSDDMRGRIMSLREFVRGIFGTWVAYGLGLGGEYFGVVTASLCLGFFIIVSVSLMALLLPSFRKL